MSDNPGDRNGFWELTFYYHESSWQRQNSIQVLDRDSALWKFIRFPFTVGRFPYTEAERAAKAAEEWLRDYDKRGCVRPSSVRLLWVDVPD